MSKSSHKQNETSGLSDFYYNNKILIWILIFVIAFIVILKYVQRDRVSTGKDIIITIEPNSDVSVGIGNTISLSANVNVSNAVVIWNSSDSTIAMVKNGNVTGIKNGKVKITASFYDDFGINHEAYCNVSVVEGDANVSLNNISFPKGDLYMPVGSEYKLNIILNPSNALINEKMFISSDDDIFTVSQDGIVKAKQVGHARIIATVNNMYKATKDVYVGTEYQNADIVLTPTTLSFDTDTRKVKLGTTEKLNYTITPNDADREKLIWKSNEPNIVSVNQKGEITAKSEGETIVSVSAINGQRADIIIEVYQEIVPVNDIVITSSVINMNAGKTMEITPFVRPTNASNQGLNYSSTDPSVVSVSVNGLGNTATLSALKKGSATIVISSGSIEKRITVNVTGSGNNSEVSEGSNLPTTIKVRSNKNNLAKTYDEAKNLPVDGSTIVSISLSVGVGKVKYCYNKYGESSCTPNTELFSDGTVTIPSGAIYVLRVIKYDYSDKEISSNSINYVNGILHYYINTNSNTKLYTVTGAYDTLSFATGLPSKIGNNVHIEVNDSNRYLNICYANNTSCIPNTRVTSSYQVKIDKVGTTRIYINEYDTNNNKIGNTEVYYVYVKEDKIVNSSSNNISNTTINTTTDISGNKVDVSNLEIYSQTLIGKYLSAYVKADLNFDNVRFCYKVVSKGASGTCNLDLTSSSVPVHNGQSYFHPMEENKTYYAKFTSTKNKTFWFDIDGLDKLYDNSDTSKDVIFEFAILSSVGYSNPIRIRINMQERSGNDSYWSRTFIK